MIIMFFGVIPWIAKQRDLRSKALRIFTVLFKFTLAVTSIPSFFESFCCANANKSGYNLVVKLSLFIHLLFFK